MKDLLPEILFPASLLDKVELHFDWRPAVENGRITFVADLIRGKEHSAISFEIRLPELTGAQLTQIQIFLERRQAGLTTHYEMARILCWLVDCSIVQTNPGLSQKDRDTKVRELLLARSGKL
jgi:hypothetical protein